MNLILNLVLCGVLVALAVAVGIYRKWMEDHCDNYLHLHSDSHDSALVTTQSSICKKLDVLDKVKTALIVAVIVYAVAIAGYETYLAWVRSGMQQ